MISIEAVMHPSHYLPFLRALLLVRETREQVKRKETDDSESSKNQYSSLSVRDHRVSACERQGPLLLSEANEMTVILIRETMSVVFQTISASCQSNEQLKECF